MPYRFSASIGLALLFVFATLNAQDKHTNHTPGMSHAAMTNQAMLTEGGQSTFAAIIEIVAVLEADPETNWSAVDITALRNHLVDMNQLMLATSATVEQTNINTIEFTVQGKGTALEAIHRMVPAHTHFLHQSRGWDINATLSSVGAKIQIKFKDRIALSKLKALGFYGFMSLDSHHQAHHLSIANGEGH